MKKFLQLLTATTVVSGIALAQPTLVANGVNPQIGDVFNLATTNGFNPGASGANQTWNFGSLTQTSTMSSTIMAVSATPNASQFGSASLASYDGSAYAYYSTSSTQWLNVGAATTVATIPYQNPETFLQYPFTNGNSFTDTWSSTFTSNSITFNRTGTTTVTGDGYGTVITPAGTFSNALRVHLVQNYSDVSQFITITYSNDEYLWFVNGYHNPVVYTFTLTNSLSGTQSMGIYATNVPSNLSIGKVTAKVNFFNMMPNPAKETLAIESSESIKEYVVYNSNGELLIRQELPDGGKALKLETNHYPNGVYMIQVKTISGATEAKRLVVAH